LKTPPKEFKAPPLPKLINVSWPVVLLVLALLAAALIGAKAVKKKLEDFKISRVRENAVRFYQNKDYSSAMISAQEVLRTRNDLEMVKILADLADLSISPVAMVYRSRIAQAEMNATNLLMLARSALQHKEPSVADQALTMVAAGDRSAKFYELSGILALDLKYPAIARAHFQKALELDPGNNSYRLNLLLLQLESNDGSNSTVEIKREMEQLATAPDSQEAASQALMKLDLQEGNIAEVLNRASSLEQQKGFSLQRELLVLTALQNSKNAEFMQRLQLLQNRTNQSGQVYRIMQWLNSRDLSKETVSWGKKLPGADDPPIQFAIAEAYVNQGLWFELLKFLERARSGELDYIRHAYLSRAHKEMGDKRLAKQTWDQAGWVAGSNVDALYTMADMAQRWGWETEALECWWTIARGKLKQRVALQRLFRHYRNAKATKNLLRVTERIFELNQRDPIGANNYAYMALLLNHNLEDASRIAEKNHEKFPSQTAFIATRSLSLIRQKEFSQAWEFAKKIPAKDHTDSQVAFIMNLAYYNYLMSASSRETFKIIDIDPQNLLQEEEAMLRQAQEQFEAQSKSDQNNIRPL